jgi:hypothetical protein
MREELDAAVAGTAPGLPTADRLCVACVDLLEVDGAAISMVLDGASHGTFGSSSTMSRRLDEFQFTFGEGPGLEAVSGRKPVLVPDLDSPHEQRWPMFAGAVLGAGVRAVFALPVTVTNTTVGALDLFRREPGPLSGNELAGGLAAAELASAPLRELIDSILSAAERGAPDSATDLQRGAGLDRVEVYQATGMLVAQLDVDTDEALLRLRAHAMATGRTASEVAWDIIERRLRLENDGTAGSDAGGAR